MQQLADYHAYFGRKDLDASAQLLNAFGFHPRNPKLAVLIGRSRAEQADTFDHAALTFKEPRVEIITYDEILDRQSLRIARELEWLRKIT
jgi:hypothetical protein